MSEEYDSVLKNWPRWRFINCWKNSLVDLFSFSLVSLWWSEQFIGVTFCNFALEYNRLAGKK